MTAKKKAKAKTKASKIKDASAETNISFEDALARLEVIVARLEEGEVPLEESLAAYAEGTQLVRRCLNRLEKAELMIQTLSENAEGFSVEEGEPGDDEEGETEGGDDLLF